MADHPTKLSPFAGWSLGLGAASLLPCLFIYFIPAICAVLSGALTVRHVRRWPGAYHGVAAGWVGIVLGSLSLVLGATAWILRLRSDAGL